MFKSKKFKIFLVASAILFVFLSGIKTGQIFYAKAFSSSSQDTFNLKTIPIILGIENSTSTLLQGDFSLFWKSLEIVKRRYYDPSQFNDEKIIYGAINGALSSLGDPYTVFFSPEDSKKFNEDLTGSFGGIGAEIGMKNNQIVIVTPLKGAPAERAGLKPGDKIIKINDTFTLNMTVDQAVKMIRGEPGTEVTLEIFREEWNSTKTFTIKREIINIPTLDWKILNTTSSKRIAYVQLYNFYAQAPSEFYKAGLAILTQNPDGMILDLRNNPGGYLDVAQEIAGWFLKRGDLFVVEKGRDNYTQKLYALGNQVFSRMPIVVLVNSGTASASEILAGALRDNRGVQIVGEQTFGKGSVQELVNLPNGSTLKITIAEWFTPKETVINKVGIKPDFEVKPTEEDIKEKRDPQLEKALEIIQNQSLIRK
jgi:carboxyl-terminal processing protease